MGIHLDKKEWKYIIILLIASYLIQFFVIVMGGETYEHFQVFIGIMMFFPTLGAIIALLKSKEGLRFIDWRIGKPLYLFLGLVIPALITFFTVIIFERLGLGTNKYFTIIEGAVEIEKELFILGTDEQSIFFFFLNFIATGIVYSLLSGLITLGEEIGWRGYLQKKLLGKNSLLKSLVFLGLIWGIWHLPLILSGYNYPDYPIIGGLFLFPVTTIFASLFLGFLTIKGRSVWPAVLAHGGVNSIMTVLLSMEFGEHKLLANFLIVGLWTLVGLVSYILLRHSNSLKIYKHSE